jgi:hypothetical protein
VYEPSRRFLAVSAVALACELVIAASTALPGAPVLPLGLVFVLFPLVFVVHARTVWAGVHGGRRMKMSDILSGVPPVAIGAFVAFFVLAWAVSYTSIAESRGQPTERAGRYYLNDHGDYIPVSHVEYLHAQVLSERSFSRRPRQPPAEAHDRGPAVTGWPAQALTQVSRTELPMLGRRDSMRPENAGSPAIMHRRRPRSLRRSAVKAGPSARAPRAPDGAVLDREPASGCLSLISGWAGDLPF